MPEIPLFNGGQSIKTGNVPQMPMDTERRPRADFRGIIAGINRIASGGQAMADAAMQPTLDPNMFAGLERGQQALAGAIMQGGQMLQRYGEMRQDAINQQDIGRARSAMQAEYMTHLAERDKANPRTWNADWTKRAESLRQRYGSDKNLSQFAKDSILGDLDGFNVTTNARLLFESSEAIHQENGDRLETQALEARESGSLAEVERIRAQQVADGHYNPGIAARMILKDKEYIRLKEQDKASSQLSTAVLTGDEALMTSALEKGKAAGWTDDDIQLKEVRARREMQEVREQKFADEERDTLGDIAFRMASGETVVPSQIDALVKAGRLSPGRASGIMEAAKREDHPLPGEWDAFIDETQKYDHFSDPKKEKLRELISKMIFMNPDKAQSTQFNAVLNEVTSRGEGSVSENQLLASARSQVREAFSKGGIQRAWNKDLEMALQDPTKLEAFGITKEKAQEIVALMQGGKYKRVDTEGDLVDKRVTADYAAAFREFKQAASTRRDKGEAGKAGLSSWAYDLFNNAATSNADGEFTDPTKARNAAFDEGQVLNRLNQWFAGEVKKNKGVPPDEMSIKKKQGELVNEALQGSASRALSPQATSANHRITSYGYASDEWADSASSIGIGAFVPDEEAAKIRKGEPSDFKLKENDFAVSPDVETKLRKAGVSPGDTVKMKLADGTIVSGRWMDRTANDQQAQALGLPPLRGRWDLYSPSGKSVKDGVSVIGFETAK